MMSSTTTALVPYIAPYIYVTPTDFVAEQAKKYLSQLAQKQVVVPFTIILASHEKILGDFTVPKKWTYTPTTEMDPKIRPTWCKQIGGFSVPPKFEKHGIADLK